MIRALAVLVFASVACESVVPAPSSPRREPQWLEVPGGRLGFDESGAGPVLVLNHDGLLSSTTWDEVLAPLAEHFCVVRWDRRGYGRSPKSESAWSDVADLHALVEHLHAERVSIAGCSSGGALAIDYALAHPERVDGLVLIGPVVTGAPYSDHFLQRGWRARLAADVDAWVEDRYLIDARNGHARELLRARLDPERVAHAFDGPHPQDEPSAVARLGELHVPALIVVGESDIPDVHAHCGALEVGLPRAIRWVVPHAGHLVQLEQPRELARRIHEFLAPASAANEIAGARVASAVPDELASIDHASPLDVEERSSEARGPSRVVDLTYASPLGGRVTAFLVLPSSRAPAPAVLYVHPGQGDRTTFLDEALELASRGLVALTIDAPSARPAPWTAPDSNFDPVLDRRQWIQLARDAIRAIDLLASRDEVDRERIGYVGHSLGATVGGIVLGLEPRVRASVLMAGLPAMSRSFVHGTARGAAAFETFVPSERRRAYLDAMAPLDAIGFVGRRAPRPLLFQWAWRDEYIARVDAALYELAAGAPQESQWYESDHFFDAQAREARIAWLVEKLGR